MDKKRKYLKERINKMNSHMNFESTILTHFEFWFNLILPYFNRS